MPTFSKPTKQQVDDVVAKLTAPQHQRRFFSQLENPHWIAPLRERGLFDHPPAPERMEGGGLRCAPWPQSRYLVRMAPLAPDEVALTLKDLDTENWVVAHDIVDAAKAMPVKIAAQLADTVGLASQSRMMGYMLTDVGELVSRLAVGGEANAALALAQQAFALRARGTKPAQRRLDEHSYFEAMRDDVVPSLARTKPKELIELLVLWMTQAVSETERPGGTLDHTSFIWRPAIEDHEQNRDFDFAAKLVGSLRDACELAIREGGSRLNDVLGVLGASSGQIFRRLRMHLIAEFAEQDPALARITMKDKNNFLDYNVKHEYARLMGKRWTLLDAADQSLWLSWVDAGPDVKYFDQPENKDRTDRQRAYWQFQRLHWIRDHLTGTRRAFYERMLGEHGVPELSDLNVYHGGMRFGHESPMTVEDLAALGFAAAVEKVAKWRPDPERRGIEYPEVDGLAGVFQAYVARDPVAFSRDALLLRQRPPIYVRGFFQVMQQAIKDAKPIDLGPVLELAAWVISRPPEEPSDTPADTRLVDPNWQWTRDTIGSLVEEVAKARDSQGQLRFAIGYRDALWRVASPLLDSQAQLYVVLTEGQDPRAVDWPSAMLNSTRGKAMMAVLAYAEWVALHLTGDSRTTGSVAGGLAAIPEVRARLETELTRSDADFAGRAVFGWRFSLLFWIDPNWLGSHTGKIFDLRVVETEPAKALGWAAWSTFLYSHRPHIAFYKLLQEQFSYAVDQAAHVHGPSDVEDKPWSRLGEHLVILFGRGDFGARCEEALVADGAIVKRLIERARVPIRSHALQFIGRSLSNQKDALPEEVLERFMGLWEDYWRTTGKQDAGSNPQSAVFGYWFSSGAFEPSWSITRLHEFVSVVPRAEPDTLIVERLAAICQHDPLRSVQVIQMFVEGDIEGWRVSGWKDEAKRVLEVAMSTGGEAQAVAKNVINRLGRRGLDEFGELLKRAGGPAD